MLMGYAGYLSGLTPDISLVAALIFRAGHIIGNLFIVFLLTYTVNKRYLFNASKSSE
jgi:hypothetical protein